MTTIDFSERRNAKIEEKEYRAFMDSVIELTRSAERDEQLEILAAFETKSPDRLRAVVLKIQERELVQKRREWIREYNT